MSSFGKSMLTLIGLGIWLVTSVHTTMAQNYQFTAFDVPSASTTLGLGINNSNTVVGAYNSFPQTGFVGDGLTFASVTITNADVVEIIGVNASGVAVGNYFDNAFVGHGFQRDAAGTITMLPDATSVATLTEPNSINGNGKIVGVYSEDPNTAPPSYHGFILENGVYTTYDVPGAQGTQLNGINDADQIVLNTDSTTHSYLLTNGALTSLDFPGADATQAFGINNRGQVVGNYTVNATVHGFVWDAGMFTTLDFPGSNDTRIFGINDQGVMVGTYDMFQHGFLIRPLQSVPEPSNLALLACSAVGGTRLLWRRRKWGSRRKS